MCAQKIALSGPVLSITHSSSAPGLDDSLAYIEDALIILDGDKILEFGPAKDLKYKLADIKLIKYKRECRIIRSVIS